ncbi:hypothetical protein WA026_014831 [Henosepilachna vigintioctopunctata]|uniref:CUB domain-containing protein n=1 Tax=Henosepilachna vigintioctopunctata TaxID=420089 RepID=A0AAW1URD6_9CUCU
MAKYVLFLSIFSVVRNVEFSEQDICGNINGKRVFLELGESGALTAKRSHKTVKDVVKNLNHNTCSAEFVTCPSCIVELNFRISLPSSCSCDYVWIYEPQYEKVSGEQFCGRFIFNNNSLLNYVSQTRNLKITFLYSMDYEHAFTINFVSKRNAKVIGGYSYFDRINNVSQQWISSPFFPSNYPTDLSSEHLIRCKFSDKCRISLSFTDYRIGQESILEFFDYNGFRMFVSTGNIFRPPILMSSGPSLAVRFYANGYTNLGYKASYTFLLDNKEYVKPSTDCGGWVIDLGGGITMMNMTSRGNTKAYDCIYIVKPPLNYSHMKTHLYVKVAVFSNFAGNTELTIRQGSTSDGPIVEVLRHPISQYIEPQKEHVVPISEGFYIGLKGMFKSASKMVIVYTAFNYKDCFSGLDFLCQNVRCIPASLTCDGFDHCGDNSDEELDCTEGLKDRRQLAKIPNFLFPSINHNSDLTTATLVFLFCSVGFVGVILGMAIYFYRSSLHIQHIMNIQSHFETINAILEEGIGDVEEEIIIPDDPPDYEAPPNYEEVMKKTNKLKINNAISEKDLKQKGCSRCTSVKISHGQLRDTSMESRGCQTSFSPIPASPPPMYCSKDPLQLSSQVGTSSSTTQCFPGIIIILKNVYMKATRFGAR